MGQNLHASLEAISVARVPHEKRGAYASDESDIPASTPAAVFLPKNVDELQALVALAREHKTPLVARGMGSGRAGGATCLGGFVVSFERMNQILEIDTENMCAWVEPHVSLAELDETLAPLGLRYAPDPNSLAFASVGGTIATNASGPRSFSHGSTRDWIMAIDVVTGTGDAIRAGFATRKSQVGYDIRNLLVGSEGTLALTHRCLLRLTERPAMTATLVIGLSSESELPGTIAQVRKKRPACLETLDQTTLGLMRRDPHARSILPKGECLLAIDFEGDEADVMARVESFANDDSLASADVTLLLQEHERTRFWDSRKQLSRRLRALAKHKVSEDVVVPITQMPTLWSEVRRIGERHQLVMPAYGHAGDGNLHVNILWNNADEKPAVELAVAELFTATLKLGGTLSGEHGIGITKRAFLPNALSAQNLSLQCEIKRVFDPDGIMNPGKIFSIGHGAC